MILTVCQLRQLGCFVRLQARALFSTIKQPKESKSSHEPRVPEIITDFHDSRITEIIDVRTPKEFNLDHIPGAINLPVLDNEERIEVGTLYTVNSFEARKTGAAEVTKNISKHIADYFQTKPQEYSPLVYCWRGGQRSNSMAIVLSQIGFQTFVLQGGYKTYRHCVRDRLKSLPGQFKYKVIAGLTGSGKTKILQALKSHGEQVLDLEKLAKHKGSVLGLWHGETQPSQKYFESLLVEELMKLDSNQTVWVESESVRIGYVCIPEDLFKKMCISPRIIINLPLEERVKHTLTYYPNWIGEKDFLKETISKLVRVRGHKKINTWMAMIDEGRIEEFVASILVEHYDPAYTLSQKKNNQSEEELYPVNIPDLDEDTLNSLVLKLKLL